MPSYEQEMLQKRIRLPFYIEINERGQLVYVFRKQQSEIIEKLENDKDVRCFCPNCGQMSEMTFVGYVRCPYGCDDDDEDCQWEGYTCTNCLNQWTKWHDYDKEDDLIAYNKMRVMQIE